MTSVNLNRREKRSAIQESSNRVGHGTLTAGIEVRILALEPSCKRSAIQNRRAVEQLEARLAHNQEVAGSSPASGAKKHSQQRFAPLSAAERKQKIGSRAARMQGRGLLCLIDGAIHC